MSLLAKIRSRLAPEPAVRTIRCTEEGFEVVVKDAVTAQVRWASVVEVAAFKRDLLTIDEICLGFRCDGDEGFWLGGEEDIGFTELQSAAEKRFPGIRTDWFREVAIPAFQENWTTIWRKPASSLTK